MTAAASSLRTRALERWAALGGLAYVVLFIVGLIVGFSGTPDGDAAPAKVAAYYQDSGHRIKIGIGWILVCLGLFFFLWFLSTLRQAVRRWDGDGFLAGLTTIGGVVYATLAFAAISINMAIATMSNDTFKAGGKHTVYPGLIHAGGDIGYVLHSTAGIGVGAMFIAASLALLRTGIAATWLAWLGVVGGVIALFSIAFFPQIVIALWIAVASALLFLRGGGPAVARTAAET